MNLSRSRLFVHSIALLLVALTLDVSRVVAEVPGFPAKPSLKPDASDAFFKTGQIPRLKIEIEQAELQKLRQNNRAYVRCRVLENDQREYQHVGIKLKGAAGSFRGVDDRPALTLNFDKFLKGQSFHDLDKMHLNNSVQDNTYLNELICSDICASAGVPAARATHARVWLNGRDLGFYVLKEGFDTQFLKRHFAKYDGNLYDGGFCQEIEGNLEKDEGKGPDDRSDLKQLVLACREPNAMLRPQKIAEVLDMDAFLSFVAVELMMCHWDGYCQNRNNYRVYFNPATKQAQFMPHGMDQMFGDANFSILHTPGALVTQAALQPIDVRARYRERINKLLPIFSPPDKLLARVDEVHARMRPVLASINENVARDHDNAVRGLKDRLVARAKGLEQLNGTYDPKPLVFDAQGIAKLNKWYTKSESPDARHEEPTVDGVPTWSITVGPSGQCVASWRNKVQLAAGTYKLRARVKSVDLAATQSGQGNGAGVRISGGQRTNHVEGNAAWQVIEHEFAVAAPQQEVELVAELRASRGQVWFDKNALQLVRAK